MSDLDNINREFRGKKATVLRKDFTLYERDLQRDAATFLKEIAARAKREKTGTVTLLAICIE